MFKVDSFVVFLAFGIAVILIVSFAVSFVQPPAEQPPAKRITTKTLAVTSNFSVSNLKEPNTISLGRKALVNGLLFGSNALAYNLTPKPEDAVLSFSVIRTNRYAPLDVRVNGNLVESRRLPKGEYRYPLDLADSTLIEVAPESSTWKIWAPALYELDNAAISTGSFVNKTKEFSFDLDKELSNFQFSNILFLLDVNDGRIFTELNGNVIYADRAVSGKTIELNKTYFKPGRNSLILRADKNSRFAGTLVFAIAYAVEG